MWCEIVHFSSVSGGRENNSPSLSYVSLTHLIDVNGRAVRPFLQVVVPGVLRPAARRCHPSLRV